MKKATLSCLFLVIAIVFAGCKKDDPEPPEPEPTPAPVAAFTIVNGGCVGPCIVSFTNESTDATSYSWNFGDNSAANTQSNPTHTYTMPGDYNVTLTATGEGGTNSITKKVTIVAPPYYLRFKVDGGAVESVVNSATRQTSVSPRTLFLSGTAASGANPKMTILLEEPSFGWSAGLNAGFNNGTPDRNIIYTDASGVVYNSLNSADGIDLFISAISYTSGGEISGTFSGVLESSTGATKQITEGAFKLKFSN